MKNLVITASWRWLAALAVLISAGMVGAAEPDKNAEPAGGKAYELRTYTVVPGRMPALLKRFREHTVPLFEKHGMHNVGYWTPQGPEGGAKLIYLLVHPSREAAEQNWRAFREDPQWQKAKAASEQDGKIVEKAESVYLTPTDFSALK